MRILEYFIAEPVVKSLIFNVCTKQDIFFKKELLSLKQVVPTLFADKHYKARKIFMNKTENYSIQNTVFFSDFRQVVWTFHARRLIHILFKSGSQL